MKIKMLVSITGTINGQPWPERGGIIDLDTHIAEDMIANKYAEPVAGPVKAAKTEVAAADPVDETAALPATKARKKTSEG